MDTVGPRTENFVDKLEKILGMIAMVHFHITIQQRPDSVASADPLDVDGRTCTPLSARELLQPQPMPVSFEQVADRLQQLPRLFFEPDGSFVWVGSDCDDRWQVDGQVTDRNGRVIYVELHGTCPVDAFDRLLSAFDWPANRLVFQLARRGVFLEEAEFRRLAELLS